MKFSPLFLLASATLCLAAEDPALTELRTAHETALRARLEALAHKELAALKALEKSSVDREDYASALSAAEAAAALGKAAPAAPAAIRLDARQPHLNGFGIIERNQLLAIAKNNATIRWDGVNLKPGTYDVQMTFSVGDLEAPKPLADNSTRPDPVYGGRISFGEISSLNAGQVLQYTVGRSNEPVEETTVKMGRLDIGTGRASFQLKALTAASDGLMLFKQIEFLPAAASTGASPKELKELASLREEYRKQIKEKTGPAQKYWLTKLQELQAQAEQTGNADALAAIKPELAHLQAPDAPDARARPITLSAPDPFITTCKGEIRLSESKDCLQRLRPVGARVSFKLAAAKVPPGKYNVTLDINLGPGMGGQYRVSCGASTLTSSLTATNALLHRVIALESPITIAPANAYLDFEVTDLSSSTASLCDLRALILTPVKD